MTGDDTAVPTPAVSVVICTRDRAPRLSRTLEAISRLDFALPWELILVDNGSSDGTAAVLERFRAGFAGSVRSLWEPKPGLAAARNRGLDSARGNIVAFTDDDCYPEPNWLDEVHRCFSERDDLGFLGGQIRLHDPLDLPMTILLVPERREFRPPSLVPPGMIQGANMAFRRAALVEVGGFDERLGPGTRFIADDIDAAFRVSATGWLGAYDPRPIVRHHHGRQDPSEVRRLNHGYLHGAGAYYAKALADRRLRSICLRKWIRHLTRKPGDAGRELAGALHFLLAHGMKGDSLRTAKADLAP